VIHLLAELIENAVSFSPPYASVQVSGQEVARGYVVEIEDRGLGMGPEDLATANERIADPPEFKLTGTPRLGLYVVSRLASRHQIQVTLKASPYGGTTVVVLIPRELINGDTDTDMEPMTEPEALPSRPLPPGASQDPPGRHRSTGEFPSQADRPGLLTTVPHWNDPSQPVQGPPVEGPDVNGSGVDRPGFATQDPEPPLPRLRSPRPRLPEPPAAEPSSSEPAYTPSGLPRRTAQAHLAPELRREPPASATDPVNDEDDGDDRSPEELRRLMESFQSGTERGRSEAARLPRRLDARPAPEDEPPMRYE
jgi:hypothetical protein